MTHEEIGKKVGKARSHVTNMMRLLTLPKEIQDAIENGVIYEGHARLILCLPDAAGQLKLFKRVVDEKLSVGAVERILYEEEKKGIIKRRTPSEKYNFLAQEELLREHLGTKVTIFQKSRRGIISIEFYSPDELKSLLQKMISE
jgi:ParB family chromosome partitioning protein